MKNYNFLIFLLLLAACQASDKRGDTTNLDSLGNLDIPQPKISEEQISEIINQIPAPIELSAMIKKSGETYNKNYLNDPESYAYYNTSFEQALNLGIYGADLGYSNLYEENQQSILYVGAIKELVDELRISQFFNFETIERLAENRDLDSLILMTTQDFNEVNAYFQEQQRSGLSVLMIAGGWIESLFIANRLYENNLENTDLRKTIGEQKIVLEKILELLEQYRESSEDFNNLHADMASLMEVYQNVEIETSYGKPSSEDEDGVLVTRDNTRATVKISDETINQIKLICTRIRNGFIS
jgi:hypothetical protein